LKNGKNVELVYKLLDIDLYITHVFEVSMTSSTETGGQHADYQKWLTTGDNAKWVRYHQRCAHMAIQRAEWDFTGSDTMKNLYSAVDGNNRSYMEEKHGKMMRNGIVSVMASLDLRNAVGFDEYVINYVWKFGNSNLEHTQYASDQHKEWQKKNGVKSSIEDKFA
jgi:hypothetical protein|tara:strand:- start:465 stop:959 length:495 start_codon:yes stop_codon:yes gene_type:complete